MTQVPEMKIKALAPWFGANRMEPERVGAELGKLDWCGVPFVGGGPELPHIKTRSGVANDLHRHMVNLARVVKCPQMSAMAAERLEYTLFHEDEFADAQDRCRMREKTEPETWELAAEPLPIQYGCDPAEMVAWAVDYFVACWMGPGASPGKTHEFRAYFASRWTATGGASVTRFRSAIDSLLGWRAILAKWEFRCSDGIEFVKTCKDVAGHGIYADCPWPDAGREYRHAFSEAMQGELADALSRFRTARVVVRFGVHPLIEKLYPRSQWTWVEATTRNQAGNSVREVLIINGPSNTAG